MLGMMGFAQSNQQSEHQQQAPEPVNPAEPGFATEQGAPPAGQPQQGSGNPWSGFASSLAALGNSSNRPAQEKPPAPKLEAQKPAPGQKPLEQQRKQIDPLSYIKKPDKKKRPDDADLPPPPPPKQP
jgi:hypothetical protein